MRPYGTHQGIEAGLIKTGDIDECPELAARAISRQMKIKFSASCVAVSSTARVS
jgi:hypothetical protein